MSAYNDVRLRRIVHGEGARSLDTVGRRYLEAIGGIWAADQVEQTTEFEGPDTTAAVFLEPANDSGGCLPPPRGYFRRLRDLGDRTRVGTQRRRLRARGLA